MKNMFWMRLGNIAPTELNFVFSNQIEQLVYQLYDLTEAEGK